MSALADTVHAVEAAEDPRVARLDDGPPLTGTVVVLPSAFNPPTRAHLHILQRAAETLGATPAALLTTRNVSKGLHGATHLQRVEMLLHCSHALPNLAVLIANRARFIEQAPLLAATFPGAEFVPVMGYDTLVRLFDPAYYTDLDVELAPFFAAHRIIATNRAHHGIEEVTRFITDSAARYASRIIPVQIDEDHAATSSTTAREHSSTGVESGLVTPEVAAYIRTNGLYREP